MLNHFCRMPLWEAQGKLIAVAMGRMPAETVIRNAKLINVCTGEIQADVDVAIACGRIALVGDADGCIGPDTRVLDASGAYIAPGFLDGHMHVESSMLSAGEYARAAIPHGTVGIYMDPHEICNVLGTAGVRLMIEESARSPLKTMVTVPSCVPAVPGFEDTGAAVTPADIREMMTWDAVVGLGEMMNYPGVLQGDAAVLQELEETLRADKTITGHWSTPEVGAPLSAYAAAGIRCCHESTTAESALAKMRLGMYAQLREGSAWQDLHAVCGAITAKKVDSRFACLVTDDTHPHTLLEKGHLDYLLRRAMEEEIDPITAIQMVTINTATCFHMEDELGSIAPGKCADIVFLDSLETMGVTRVLIDGEIVAENGRVTFDLAPFAYPAWATDTMHVGERITPETFAVPAPDWAGETVDTRVIEVMPARAGTYARRLRLPVTAGRVEANTEMDVLKVFVFERHKATGKHGAGFVKGFGIRCGALAQTVAHDAHNLLVVGTNDADMALAANTLIDCGGGLCAVADGKVLGLVPLPIAGLMDDRSAEEMAARVAALTRAWGEVGCTLPSPFMTLGLISLACIPELRLTNRGYVDCVDFCQTALFPREEE